MNSSADLDHSEAEAISGRSFTVLLFLTLSCHTLGILGEINSKQKNKPYVHALDHPGLHLVPSTRGKPVNVSSSDCCKTNYHKRKQTFFFLLVF